MPLPPTALLKAQGEEATLGKRESEGRETWGAFAPEDFDITDFTIFGKGWAEVTWRYEGDYDPDDYDPEDYYCSEDIHILISNLSSMVRQMDVETTQERYRFTTVAPIEHHDRVIYNGEYFEIDVEPMPHFVNNYFWYWSAEMVKRR